MLLQAIKYWNQASYICFLVIKVPKAHPRHSATPTTPLSPPLLNIPFQTHPKPLPQNPPPKPAKPPKLPLPNPPNSPNPLPNISSQFPQTPPPTPPHKEGEWDAISPAYNFDYASKSLAFDGVSIITTTLSMLDDVFLALE